MDYWCSLLVCLLSFNPWLSSARAHDLITAEYADRYLALATRYSLALKSTDPSSQRAEAAYLLGRMLDEIREYLNRDIASHGKVQGLASHRLVSELKARGTPLAQDANGHFLANLAYYRQSLRLAPSGEHEGDALFKLLQGYFYDSFDDDPLKPKNQTWEQLAEQIQLGERLVQRYPKHSDLEEAKFILLIHYVQAARQSNDGSRAREMTEKARAAIAEFKVRYPESMRAAALPMMSEALPIN